MTGKAEGRVRTLAMRDGAELHYRHWPTPKPRGVVIAVHGIQSHSGWYVSSCAHLAAAGYEVMFLDRRGSGLNKFGRGDAGNFRVLLDDLCEFAWDARRRLGRVPLHLEAISWGAKLACAGLILHPALADSLMLVGPGLISKIGLGYGERLKTALALVTDPQKLFDIPLRDARLFTNNPARIAYVEKDTLSLRKCTARFLCLTRKLDKFIRRNTRKLHVPLCVMLAGRDRIVDNEAVRKLVARFASSPKEIIEYPAASHTLEFEPDPTPIFDDMVRRLDARS